MKYLLAISLAACMITSVSAQIPPEKLVREPTIVSVSKAMRKTGQQKNVTTTKPLERLVERRQTDPHDATTEQRLQKIRMQLIQETSSMRTAATNVIENDSLALVDFYNSTGGPNWTNNTNWLVEGQPVSTWVGVTVVGDRVTGINLPGNNLTGSIPSSFGNLALLDDLGLDDNLLTGPIPEEIGQLTNLIFFWARNNQFSGELPSSMGNLTNLLTLLLNGNELSGTIPQELGNLTNLEILWMSSNQLTGEIPASLGTLQNLTWIDLRFNNLTGGFPDFFLNTITDGYYNSAGIFKGPGLELLLSGNQLSGPLPTFASDVYLTRLVIDQNEFTGPIPNTIGNLDSLEFVNLGGNQLAGPIPGTIGTLSRLTGIRIWSMPEVTGTIPSEIGNLSNLIEIDFGNNSLSGNLPTSIGNCTNLQLLYINDNSMSGDLPLELASLSNLTNLSILNNNFTGIPDLTGLSNLIDLRMAGNQFEFDDIEPLISIAGISYAPQQSLSNDTLIYDLASPLNLDFTIGGSANQYQWFLNGDTLVGEITPAIQIPPGSTDDYQLQVTSSLVPDLTITSGLYRFLSEPTFNTSPALQFPTYQLSIDETSLFVGSAGGDLNDDGIQDLVVAFRERLYIYFGDRFIGPEPDIVYSPSEGEIQNAGVAKGDADTIDDIVISISNQTDGTQNWIQTISGSTTLSSENLNLGSTNYDVFLPSFGIETFTGSINLRNLGDINNDGFPEAGLSAPNGSNILVILGGSAFDSGIPPIVVPQPTFAGFNTQMFALGDVNGDGFGDFMTSNISQNDIYIYFGGLNPDLSTPSLVVEPDTSSFFRNQNFFAINALGVDVNNDTFNDVLFRPAISEDNTFRDIGLPSIFVLYGGPGIDNVVDDAINTPTFYRSGENSASDWGVNDFQLIGDYDGDGIDDIYLGPDQSEINNPNATIFSSQNLSSASIPGITLIAPNQETGTFGGNDNNIFQNTDIAFGDFNDNGLTELVAGQPSESGYNLFIYENFQAPGDLFYDSLVLAGIYQDTDGDNWTNNGNWLEGAVDTWEGVTITTSRVRSINLANNGLKGELVTSFDKLQELESIDLSNNQISGQLNESLLVLPQLTSLNVANNEFTRIPDFNNASSELLSTIDVSENRLDFGDLEPVFEITGLNYANQKNLKLEQDDTVLLAVGRDTTVSVATSGSLLSYQWRYEDGNITNATDSTFIIENIGRSNMGDYSVQITSGIVPNLTLNSDPVQVLATAIVTANILGTQGELIPDPISASLMETVRRQRGYDTLAVQTEVTSSFSFEPVILLDYLVGVSSDPELYVDTYYQNVFEWQEADVMQLQSDTTINISITTIPQPTEPGDGEGIVRGVIEEDFGEEEGRIEARRRAKGRKCGLKIRRRGGRPGQTDDFELFAYGETNDQGEFEFGFLPEGTYRFFVEYPGIPLDETSFVQFDIGEAGVTDDDFTLAAIVSEEGIVVELILGLTSQFFTDFSVYPNPTTDKISVKYDKILSENLVMQLIDMNGNTLESRNVQKGKNGQLEISLSKYSEGMYFLKFYDEKSGDTALTFRILKK